MSETIRFKTYRLNDSSLEESPKSKGKRLTVAKKQHCVMCKGYCTARKNVWVRDCHEFCVHGIIGARYTGTPHEHDYQETNLS